MDPIEQIKQRIDIADFIREFFPLHLAGSNYKARCPFHQEKSAHYLIYLLACVIIKCILKIGME